MKNYSLLLLLAITLLLQSCSKENETPIVYDLKDPLPVSSYKNLHTEFLKWAFIPPFDDSPLTDITGVKHKNQHVNGVVILAPNIGGIQTRSLTIKSKDLIYAPVTGMVFFFYDMDPCYPDYIPAPGQSDLDFMKGEAQGGLETASNLSLNLNGSELVTDIRQFKQSSDIVQMKLSSDVTGTMCDYSQMTAKVYAESYAVAFKLPKDIHILKVKGSFENENFHQDIAWKLTVE